ncbi:MAG: acetylglutamate kinase [Verrucomicrobiota bacterium]|nr:acetylglutamate kinase [Verrucomicrobiota bacterium]
MDFKGLQEKAEALIEALPYMQMFRGKTVVIKYGGSAMEEEKLIERVIRDIVFLEVVGVNPVIVHGGGKAITAKMKAAGLKAEFMDGLRVTDLQSIRIVEEVLATEINPSITKKILEFGGNAKGYSGKEIFQAEKMYLTRASGERIDIGYVGSVTGVNVEPLLDCIKHERVPVISPVGGGKDGATYNINADIAAGEIAVALKAHKIVYISDVNGIMRDPTVADSLISTVTISEIQTLIKDGVITAGMIPKVDSAIKALEQGVEKVHFIDGKIAHSLLLEMFTNAGIGTQIIRGA